MPQFEKNNRHGKGRALGSKNRLTAQILEHMEIVWNELVTAGKITSIESKSTGLSALRTMVRQDPSGFISFVAQGHCHR
jgi:hypothetical protein